MHRVGHYALAAPLGQGAMGVVYRGLDETSGRACAVKVLDPELARDPDTLARFLAEARTLMRVRHENVVEVLDVGAGETNFMVMELLAGEPLSQVLAHGRMALERAVRIAADLAGALAAVHAAGVVHRDIKPDNLMVTAEGALKLIDFGVARAAADMNVMHTQNGALLGTPAYMAPEQVCGKPVDARADIYAFGAVLYEMITGARAFTADNFAALAVQHLTFRPPPPSARAERVPPSLDQLVAQCLAKEPSDRPADMDEVETLLRQMQIYLQNSPAMVAARKQRRLWPVAAAVLATMVVAGGWRFVRHDQAPPPALATEPAPAPLATASPVAVAPPAPAVVEPQHAPTPRPKNHPTKKRVHRDFDKAELIDAFAP